MSQLQTATSRHHPRPASPVEMPRSVGSAVAPPVARVEPMTTPATIPVLPVTPVGSPAHALWWERLPTDERWHTRACVERDEVDAWMLDILGRSAPVGPYGLRWAGDSTTFLPGSFVDFVRGVAPDPADD